MGIFWSEYTCVSGELWPSSNYFVNNQQNINGCMECENYEPAWKTGKHRERIQETLNEFARSNWSEVDRNWRETNIRWRKLHILRLKYGKSKCAMDHWTILDCVSLVKIRGKHFDICIIQEYVPTMSRINYDFDRRLQCEIKKINFLW